MKLTFGWILTILGTGLVLSPIFMVMFGGQWIGLLTSMIYAIIVYLALLLYKKAVDLELQ